MAREEPAVQVRKSRQHAATGRREGENDRRHFRRETLGVVGHKSAQQDAAREEPVVRECKSRQCVVARSNKTFKMACKYINASIYFISLAAYGMHPMFTVVGTFIFQVQGLGAGRNVALTAAYLLPVTTLTRH